MHFLKAHRHLRVHARTHTHAQGMLGSPLHTHTHTHTCTGYAGFTSRAWQSLKFIWKNQGGWWGETSGLFSLHLQATFVCVTVRTVPLGSCRPPWTRPGMYHVHGGATVTGTELRTLIRWFYTQVCLGLSTPPIVRETQTTTPVTDYHPY